MSPNVIRSLLAAEPFEPFTIHMPHGGDYDIDRPERVEVPPSGGVVRLLGPNGEMRAVLSLDHVSSVSLAARPHIRGGVS